MESKKQQWFSISLFFYLFTFLLFILTPIGAFVLSLLSYFDHQPSLVIGELLWRAYIYLVILVSSCLPNIIVPSNPACLFFPFSSIIILALVAALLSWLLPLILPKLVVSINNTLKWCLIFSTAVYFAIFLIYSAYSIFKQATYNSELSSFNREFTFDKIISSKPLIYVARVDGKADDKFASEGVVISDLSGKQKKVLFSRSLQDSLTTGPSFPSPKGNYYMDRSGTVKTVEGIEYFETKIKFSSYNPGVARWSDDERYIAISAEALDHAYGQAPNTPTLHVYDIQSKNEIWTLSGVSFGDFVWGTANDLYFPCGSQTCVVTPTSKDSLAPSALPGSIACTRYSYARGNVYCAVSQNNVPELLKDKVVTSKFIENETKHFVSPSVIISQKLRLNENTTISLASPLQLGNKVTGLYQIDENYLAVTTAASVLSNSDMLTLAIIELNTGKFKKIDSPSALQDNPMYKSLYSYQGAMPIPYTGTR